MPGALIHGVAGSRRFCTIRTFRDPVPCTRTGGSARGAGQKESGRQDRGGRDCAQLPPHGHVSLVSTDTPMGRRLVSLALANLSSIYCGRSMTAEVSAASGLGPASGLNRTAPFKPCTNVLIASIRRTIRPVARAPGGMRSQGRAGIVMQQRGVHWYTRGTRRRLSHLTGRHDWRTPWVSA
jgi:hypothetical protein